LHFIILNNNSIPQEIPERPAILTEDENQHDAVPLWVEASPSQPVRATVHHASSPGKRKAHTAVNTRVLYHKATPTKSFQLAKSLLQRPY
jgi:hypothetical protein